MAGKKDPDIKDETNEVEKWWGKTSSKFLGNNPLIPTSAIRPEHLLAFSPNNTGNNPSPKPQGKGKTNTEILNGTPLHHASADFDPTPVDLKAVIAAQDKRGILTQGQGGGSKGDTLKKQTPGYDGVLVDKVKGWGKEALNSTLRFLQQYPPYNFANKMVDDYRAGKITDAKSFGERWVPNAVETRQDLHNYSNRDSLPGQGLTAASNFVEGVATGASPSLVAQPTPPEEAPPEEAQSATTQLTQQQPSQAAASPASSKALTGKDYQFLFGARTVDENGNLDGSRYVSSPNGGQMVELLGPGVSPMLLPGNSPKVKAYNELVLLERQYNENGGKFTGLSSTKGGGSNDSQKFYGDMALQFLKAADQFEPGSKQHEEAYKFAAYYTNLATGTQSPVQAQYEGIARTNNIEGVVEEFETTKNKTATEEKWARHYLHKRTDQKDKEFMDLPRSLRERLLKRYKKMESKSE